MKRFSICLLLMVALGAVGCTLTVPGVQGYDKDTGTLTVDKGALTPDTEAKLKELGITVNKVGRRAGCHRSQDRRDP